MLYKLQKYKKQRKLFKNLEKKIIFLKSLYKNQYFSRSFRERVVQLLQHFSFKVFQSNIKNICVLSSKRGGVFRCQKLSRHMFKQLIESRKLKNYNKFSW